MADTHTSRGYTEWWCPAMANADTLTGTGQLPKFEDDLFKTREGLYLIPTAEVQLTNIHSGEVLEAADAAASRTARSPRASARRPAAPVATRAASSACTSSTRWRWSSTPSPRKATTSWSPWCNDAENILQLLGLPYRVISLCTGDIGFSAAKTYDLEVWLPSYGSLQGDLAPARNCVDFQARRANIKYRDPENFKGSRYVHTLNGSGLAVGRTMAAIMENYQQADGTIKVPEVLVPYMGGVEVIGDQA